MHALGCIVLANSVMASFITQPLLFLSNPGTCVHARIWYTTHSQWMNSMEDSYRSAGFVEK